MSTRITNIERDLPALNKKLSELDNLRTELKQLRQITQQHAKSLTSIEKTREFTGVNNIEFTWTGGTLTLSWTAGSVQDRNGNYVPVSTGSKALSANTHYWAAWNPVHSVMAFAVDLSTLNQNSGNLVLCRIHTGTGGQAGVAGGGGADSGLYGGWDPNRTMYNYF